MHSIFPHSLRAFLAAGLFLNLAGCATSPTAGTPSATATSTSSTASAVIESMLPLIRTGAAVATGAVLDFSVQQSSTRTRLANEMYTAASAVYSLSGGSFPSPAQLAGTIAAFGGTQSDAAYASFSSAIAGLYASWYPKLSTGDTKTASDLLNAVAGGIEDATKSYVTTPVTGSVVTVFSGAQNRTLLAQGTSSERHSDGNPRSASPSNRALPRFSPPAQTLLAGVVR